MTCEQFEHSFENGELENSPELIEWSMQLKTHRRLQARLQALRTPAHPLTGAGSLRLSGEAARPGESREPNGAVLTGRG